MRKYIRLSRFMVIGPCGDRASNEQPNRRLTKSTEMATSPISICRVASFGNPGHRAAPRGRRLRYFAAKTRLFLSVHEVHSLGSILRGVHPGSAP
jgi:hypothetical protein